MNNDYLFNEFANSKNTSDLFFVINGYAFSESVFKKLQIENTEKIFFPGFFVIKATPPKTVMTLTKEFYSQMEILADDDAVKLRAYDGLFLAGLFEKNCDTVKKYLAKYTELAEKKREYSERTKLHNKRYRFLCRHNI